MKKIISLVILIMVFLCTVIPVFAAGNAEFVVSVSSDKVAPGDEIVVTVSLTAGSKCRSMGFRPQFDKASLEIVSGECLVKNAVIADFSKQDGTVALLEEATAYNGDLCRFTLRVKDDAAPGTLELGGKCAAKNDADALTCNLKSAKITVFVAQSEESTSATATSAPDENVVTMQTIPAEVVDNAVDAVTDAVLEEKDTEATEKDVASAEKDAALAETEAIAETEILTSGADYSAPERKFPIGAVLILVVLVAALVGVLVYSRRRR